MAFIGEHSAERALVFILLCACVLYLAKVVRDFRGLGLTVRSGAAEEEASELVEDERDHDE